MSKNIETTNKEVQDLINKGKEIITKLKEII